MLFHLRSPDRLSHDDGDIIDFLSTRQGKTVKTPCFHKLPIDSFWASTFTSSTIHFLYFGTLVSWTLFTKLWNNCQVLDPNQTGPNKISHILPTAKHRGSFDGGGNGDVGRQVGAIDLEFATNLSSRPLITGETLKFRNAFTVHR